MGSDIILSDAELEAITGYEQATKQLNILHDRGFVRAWINRDGKVVLERSHYEAVTRGEFGPRPAAPGAPAKSANLSMFRAA